MLIVLEHASYSEIGLTEKLKTASKKYYPDYFNGTQ